MNRLLFAVLGLLSLSACYDDGYVPTYSVPAYSRPAPTYVPRTYYVPRPVYVPAYRPVYVPRYVHAPRYRHR
jgi:hypothetical protein